MTFKSILQKLSDLFSVNEDLVPPPKPKRRTPIRNINRDHSEEAQRTLAFLNDLLDGDEAFSLDGDLLLSGIRIKRMPSLELDGDLYLQQCERLQSFGPSLVVQGNCFIGGRVTKLNQDLHLAGPTETPWWREHTGIINPSARLRELLKKPSWTGSAPFEALAENTDIKGSLTLRQCKNLSALPPVFTVGGAREVVGCTALAKLPDNLVVPGHLRLVGLSSLHELPAGLEVGGHLIVDGLPIRSLPEDLKVGSHLILQNCPKLETIPSTIPGTLRLRNCGLSALPDALHVQGDLTLSRCAIEALPGDLHVQGDLELNRCQTPARLAIPETIHGSLLIRNCNTLQRLPQTLDVKDGLELVDCPQLEALPADLTLSGWVWSRFPRCSLFIVNCPKITTYPDRLKAAYAVDLAGSTIREANANQYRNTKFFWRGFPIDGQALFEPHKMDPREILAERNTEVRRIMIEQYGIEELEQTLEFQVIDQDEDPGGPRRLLLLRATRINLSRPNLDTAFLDCRCPSTARRFLLQVPAQMTSCHEAAAWMAGFDIPDDYKPLLET